MELVTLTADEAQDSSQIGNGENFEVPNVQFRLEELHRAVY